MGCYLKYTLLLITIWAVNFPVIAELYKIGIEGSLDSVLAEYPEIPAPKCYHNGAQSVDEMQKAYRYSKQSLQHRLNASGHSKDLATALALVRSSNRGGETQTNIQAETLRLLKVYTTRMHEEITASRKLNKKSRSALISARRASGNEALKERVLFVGCMEELTKDAFRAYERVHFFTPRMVASGSHKDQQWIQSIEIINSSIRNIDYEENRDFEDALHLYNITASQISGVVSGYSEGLPHVMSSKMAVGWACGSASTAASALLSWTRVPDKIKPTSFEQVQTIFEDVINNAFENVSNACVYQMGGSENGEDISALLVNTVRSGEKCNKWITHYKNTALGCLSYKEYASAGGSVKASSKGDEIDEDDVNLKKILSVFSDVGKINSMLAKASNSANRKFGYDNEMMSLNRTIYIKKHINYAIDRMLADKKQLKALQLTIDKATLDLRNLENVMSKGERVTYFFRNIAISFVSMFSSVFDNVYAAVLNSTELLSRRASCIIGVRDSKGNCRSMEEKIDDWLAASEGEPSQTDIEIANLSAKISDELQAGNSISKKATKLSDKFEKYVPYLQSQTKIEERKLGHQFFGDENGMKIFTALQIKKFQFEAKEEFKRQNLFSELSSFSDQSMERMDDNYVMKMYKVLDRNRKRKERESNYVFSRESFQVPVKVKITDNFVEEYDYGDALIHTDLRASLFKIISNRYMLKKLWIK